MRVYTGSDSDRDDGVDIQVGTWVDGGCGTFSRKQNIRRCGWLWVDGYMQFLAIFCVAQFLKLL